MEELESEDFNEPTEEEKEVLKYLENNEWLDDEEDVLIQHTKETQEPALDLLEPITSYLRSPKEKKKRIPIHIKGMFYVEYHLKRGPEIQWKHIEGTIKEEETLALKCMPSGLHRVTSDYILFTHEGDVALSVSHVERDKKYERGSHTQSIVILVENDASLATHIEFLREKVQQHPVDTETIASYMDMVNDAEDKNEEDITLQQLSTQFVDVAALCHRYGPLILTIWKALILKQRILFYQTLPIGRTTSMLVGFLQLLGNHQEIQNDDDFDPKMEQLFTVLPTLLYYVQIMDLDILQTTPFYLATTSDPSLKNYPECYDLWIEQGEIQVSPKGRVSQIFDTYGFSASLILPTPSDKRIFAALSDRLHHQSGLFGHLEVVQTFHKLNLQLWHGLTMLWHTDSHHGKDPVEHDRLSSYFHWTNATIEDLRFIQACFLAMRLQLNIFKHHLDHHVQQILYTKGYYKAYIQYYFCGMLPTP
mmetsp:Transcript_14323/g.21648  ORF Transcript_14323/g.21648 Transcript_14323/m.21648 type:complete len:477 (-) Transcript_14323:15-1445(-)